MNVIYLNNEHFLNNISTVKKKNQHLKFWFLPQLEPWSLALEGNNSTTKQDYSLLKKVLIYQNQVLKFFTNIWIII